ncbi:MAG: AAA family ATPase [Treponema sp.]|nr:AAA family ATPase [Treponema sp.]
MNVFKIKTGSEETYAKFNNPSVKKILVDHLIQYDELIKIGEPVFFLFGGDGTPWENGLAGLCKIASQPLDLGYEIAKNGKYYKLELEIIYKLKTHMTKMDFSRYPETFDTGIGPSTKGERNQALGVIENKSAVAALCRAVMDKEPEISNCIREIFGEEIFKIATQNSIVYKKQVSNPEEKKSAFYTPNFSQIIYYGVPGSGKSHKIDEETENLPDDQKMRVVYHPEYTNADFIGQILPVMEGNGVRYAFKSGAFTKILIEALKNPSKPYYLIIEEINRGNAAAIFGEIFQLLDRGSDGWSSYCIMNDYINYEIRKSAPELNWTENTGVRLPPNLSLLATMNTSDQNVFTLDNAFQRRWDMQLVPNECSDTNQMEATITVANQKITWKDFQQTINSVIGEKANEGGLSSMEDKRLGCWFVKAENKEIKADLFSNKVLKYLWDDAFKFYHQDIFDSEIRNFEELQKSFMKKGFDVFNENCGLGKVVSTSSTSMSESISAEAED